MILTPDLLHLIHCAGIFSLLCFGVAGVCIAFLELTN